MELKLGTDCFDLTSRALVIGILNRTRDSFYGRGAHFALDAFLRHAERLVNDGADVLEVGARPGGVGVREVAPEEEIALSVQSIEELRHRFDVPIGVDTQRAAVARAAFAAGAVLGNDMSGFRDPDYLPVAAAADAAVVATHIRLPPGVPDPDPRYVDLVEDVACALRGLADRARAAGVGRERIVLDPGYDLGKTWEQTLVLLAHTARFAELGRPVLIAVSNKIFLSRLLGLDRQERGPATVAACAYGLARGGRVLRMHDVRAGRQVADLLAALLEREADDAQARPAARSSIPSSRSA
jgi:dihydropteroate synthase